MLPTHDASPNKTRCNQNRVSDPWDRRGGHHDCEGCGGLGAGGGQVPVIHLQSSTNTVTTHKEMIGADIKLLIANWERQADSPRR